MSDIPNILAERYASPAMRDIWSPTGRIRLERQLWIAVMKAQQELGLDIPSEAIAAYESVVDQIDTDAIAARERVTRHDVKARIEEFCDLAGHEHIHKGMTSRDLTENVEQLQIYRALEVIRLKTAAALVRLSRRARHLAPRQDCPACGRQAVERSLHAQLLVGGEMIAGMDDDPFCAEAPGEVHVGAQVLVGGSTAVTLPASEETSSRSSGVTEPRVNLRSASVA